MCRGLRGYTQAINTCELYEAPITQLGPALQADVQKAVLQFIPYHA
jgi:hypothetical protein